MKYTSTRNKQIKVGAAQAIAQGISKEGGLFVPEVLPALGNERLEDLIHKTYQERACDILEDFLDDFTPAELRECVQGAYGGQKFADPRIAPMSRLDRDIYMLELWHGPTCAFKDMALQLLPHLLTRSVEKVSKGKEVVILVATSGDTGKAALEGFRDVPGTEILVFYPQDGVSKIQKLQMQTQEGQNVGVCGVCGNFDDTQTGVKAIFTDPALRERLAGKNMMFSSANSINWGRLVPQIVYYVSAYCDLVKNEQIALGDTVNVAVPTGNFGNILAAYYAKRMGLPIHRFICASNVNKVLADFIETGVYDRRREFVATSSPSMDILISSNLERLLFELHDGDDKAVSKLMRQLSEQGAYTVSERVRAKLQSEFSGGYCDEAETAATIRKFQHDYDYLCDTHTAVALKVQGDYVKKTGDDTKTIVVSTANPFKFTGSMLDALGGSEGGGEFAQAEKLAEMTGTEIPPQIKALRGKPVRFDQVCKKAAMTGVVERLLKL